MPNLGIKKLHVSCQNDGDGGAINRMMIGRLETDREVPMSRPRLSILLASCVQVMCWREASPFLLEKLVRVGRRGGGG